MNYHHLQPNDTEKVAGLMAVFAATFEDPTEYLGKPPTPDYTKRLLQNPNNIVLVATTETDEVVAGLVAYELQKFEQKRSEVYLYDLAVAESFRRQGIATGLISELKTIAKGRGAKIIFVQADNVDTPAVALYTKLANSAETDITHFDIYTDK